MKQLRSFQSSHLSLSLQQRYLYEFTIGTVRTIYLYTYFYSIITTHNMSDTFTRKDFIWSLHGPIRDYPNNRLTNKTIPRAEFPLDRAEQTVRLTRLVVCPTPLMARLSNGTSPWLISDLKVDISSLHSLGVFAQTREGTITGAS